MSKYSQKQTNYDWVATNSVEKSIPKNGISGVGDNTKQWVGRAKENKFSGMSDNTERVEPVIIPGYKLRG